MLRSLVAVVLVSAGLLAVPEQALACSCAVGDPRLMLAEADAGFVGMLIERREPAVLRSSDDPVTLVFRVETPVKGELGELVEVETAALGASCGIEAGRGERLGLFLTSEGDGWTSGLCAQIEPAELLEAAGPIPPAGGGSERPPAAPETSGSTWEVPLLAALGFAAAVALGLRLRRRRV